MKKVNNSINTKLIFKNKKLSYHTKCILIKILTDFLYIKEELNYSYLEDSVFTVWSDTIVWNALNELADNDIMFIDMCDCEECNKENCENDEKIIFNSEFLEKVCPYYDSCPHCSAEPVNFNLNYN